jgi:hypothetical protein
MIDLEAEFKAARHAIVSLLAARAGGQHAE